MGIANNDYIPAAILFLNPGLTKDEFVHELNKIHHDGKEVDYHQDFGHCDPDESHLFHHGIFGLAEDVLRLPRLEDVCVLPSFNSTSIFDEDEGWRDIQGARPRLRVLARQAKNRRWLSPSYSLRTHVANRFGDEVEYEGMMYFPDREFKQGAIFRAPILEPKGIDWRVKKIHKIRKMKSKTLLVNITAEQVLPVFADENYANLAGLVKNRPEYDPNLVFDWERERGILCGGLLANHWGWMRKGNRYYLDDFPPSRKGYCEPAKDESNYTGIAITAEAIKAKAWHLFGFHGYEQTWRFLAGKTPAYAVYQQAVFDWWMNSSAEGKLTVAEHLRRRVVFGSNAPRPILDDRTALSIVMNSGLGRYFRWPGNDHKENPEISRRLAESLQNCPF